MSAESAGKRLRVNWRLWIGLAFSAVCLWLATRGVDLREMVRSLGAANPFWLLLAVASVAVTFWLKAVRWRLLFEEPVRPSLSRSFAVLCIGLFVNAFFPARLGEIARALLVGQETGRSYTLGTIVVEKVADLVLFAAMTVVLLARLSLPEWLLEPARASMVLMAVAVVGCAVLAWKGGFALRILALVSRLLPEQWAAWLSRQASQGLASLEVLRRPRVVAGVLGWSAVIWVLGAVTNYVVFVAVGIEPMVLPAVLLLVVLQAGVAVPSSPGRLGVFHYLAIITLSLFAVGKDEALVYAVALHLSVYLPMIVLGLWYMWREEVSWTQLWPARPRATALPGTDPS
ncbi:MAG: lysylphosphatidylglycerol synthase transmembrane domain-containing protein [Anaerolineae bacterium]